MVVYMTHLIFQAQYSLGCGGHYYANYNEGIKNPGGQISSPDYPNAYPTSKTCEYFISDPDARNAYKFTETKSCFLTLVNLFILFLKRVILNDQCLAI